MAEEQEKNVYHDVDVYGNENSDGTPKYHFDEEAIKNALSNWIGAKKGDYIRNPELGGVIDRFLFKTMNGKNSALLSFTLQNAIINEFAPELTLLALDVIPNYEQRFWEIHIKYKSSFSGQTESIVIYTKDLSDKESLDYVSVEYTGNNLYSFCETKLPSMGNELIVYNEDREKWVWGQYSLDSFDSTTDSRAEDILELVNGS